MNLNPEILDLVIERSTQGLSSNDQMKLDQLIQVSQDPNGVLAEIERFELSIAALELSRINEHHSEGDRFSEPPVTESSLSSSLQERIRHQSIEAIESNATSTNDNRVLNRPSTASMETVSGSRRPVFKGVLIWTVAAASLLALAMFIRQSPNPEQAIVESPTIDQIGPSADLVGDMMPSDEQMKRFLGSTPEDLLTLTWTPVDNKNVTGEVFWSDQQQTGFIALRGLEVNDPKRKQYQVWIYDTDTKERRPVNGGVFDVSKTGRYVVPIAPLSPVKKAVQFSITAEQPGGVDVSDQEEVPTVASQPF